jgi:hypothetical protein
MLPAVWAPSPDYKEAKGVIANYVVSWISREPGFVRARYVKGAPRFVPGPDSAIGVVRAIATIVYIR